MRIVASVQSKRGSSRGLVHYVVHSKLDIEKEPGEGRELFNAFTDNLSVKSANNSLKGADISRGRPSNDELHHLVLSFRPDDYRKLGSGEMGRGRALKEITRAAMKSLEDSLGAERIAWAASVHLNTENPHVHIALQKEYFTKEIERHRLSKIPREALPHYESRSGERVLVPGILIDSATQEMEALIDRELVFVKDHKNIITNDVSAMENKDKPGHRSVAKTAGERATLGRGLVAEYSRRRIDWKIESLVEHGHDMRFRVFDPLSGRKRRLSLRDIERREGATAGAKEGYLDSRSDPESAMVRRIKTILFKMVSKEETVKARLQKSFGDHTQEAAEIRTRYRREGRKFPVPALSKKELDMIQGYSMETSDIRGFAYLERIRSALTKSGEIEARNKDDIHRLRAQKTVSFLRSKLYDKTYGEFSESRYDRLVEIYGKSVSLAELDRGNRSPKSAVAVITGKLSAFAKQITGSNADQGQKDEKERLRSEILRKLDERASGIAKERSVEDKKTRLLDKIISASDEKFAGNSSGVFNADQMVEVETMALRLRLASIYEINWAEQRSLIEKSGPECPAFRRLAKATRATDFAGYKNEIIAGRALALEIVAKIELDKAKEDLNIFKKAKRFQKFAVTDPQTGGIAFVSLKDVELPKAGTILDRVVDELLEGKDHRRIRKTVTAIVKEKERNLKAEVGAAKEVANSATRIASEFKQFALLGLQSEPTHSRLFSSAEIVMIELRAAKTSDPRDAARLNAVIDDIADRPTRSLAGILRDFENSQQHSPESRERSAQKTTGSERDGAYQNLRDIAGEVRPAPVDAPKRLERSPRDPSHALGR